MPKRILVSGASGFLGSHFAKFFSKAGHHVVGLDLVPPPEPILKYLDGVVEANIGDMDQVGRTAMRFNIGAVVHCAAYALVAESVQKPQMYFDNNVRKGALFVEALSRSGVENFLFSSSAAVYGEPKKTPIPEEHPTNPINPYGQSKLQFEKELQFREKAGKLHVGILRYFNAAGADPDLELVENHHPETHLIPNALRATMESDYVCPIYGSDYPTRDGTCERDYIHVWDLAEAHLLLLDRLMKTGSGGVYNLGTGRGYTLKEVLDEIDQQAFRPVRRKMVGRRPGDPAILVADPSKAKKELGWSPKLSDLKTIVSTALASVQKQRSRR